jgi:DeoR family suf operon transcriptional repressor
MARTTRDGILAALKRRGEARAEDLAAALGVTVSALRQHLVALAGEGLVGHREVRSGPGRPKHLYSLTPAAEALFPKTYDELTNELLDYVSDESPELLERVFERRRRRRVAGASARVEAAGPALADRVAELARVLDEDGYLAEVVDWPESGPGVLRVVEHNCAILGVAARYGQACTSELDFIRAVLPDATIERVSHIMAGQRQCAYEIRPAVSRPTRRAPARARAR